MIQEQRVVRFLAELSRLDTKWWYRIEHQGASTRVVLRYGNKPAPSVNCAAIDYPDWIAAVIHKRVAGGKSPQLRFDRPHPEATDTRDHR